MKKVIKKIVFYMFAIGMLASVMLVPNVQAEASTAPAKVHARVLSRSYIDVKMDAGDYKIANLKTSSKKNLIVRITDVGSGSDYSGSVTITVYAKKKGKYKVNFDVVDKNNKVKKHHTVQVFANLETPVKKITIGGKTLYDGANPVYGTMIFPKASGKLKIKMTKGYSIESIEMTTYDKDGNSIIKQIRNGRKIKLGQYRSKYISPYNGPERDYWYGDLFADTKLCITYDDKYTNTERIETYTVHRPAKN